MHKPWRFLNAVALLFSMIPALVSGQSVWVQHTLYPGDEQYSVAYGNNQFVSVGLGGVNFVSPDGEVWTPESSGTLVDLRSITFAGNQFIAVGDRGTILTSQNGDVWKAESSGTSNNLNFVKLVNNQFFALGGNATMLVSTDGKAWTKKATNSFSSLAQLTSITFGNNIYVLTCGLIMTSPDLSTWTDCSPEGRFGNTFTSVVYAANRFVAIGSDTIAVSFDGKTWQKRNSNVLNDLYCLTYGNGQFIAGGAFSPILSSPDGMVWTIRFPGTGALSSLQSIIFEQHTFVAVGWPNILTSKADSTGIKSKRSISLPSRGKIGFGTRYFQLPMVSTRSKDLTLEFFDAAGREIFSIPIQPGNNVLKIPSKWDASGMYLLRCGKPSVNDHIEYGATMCY